MLKYIWLLFIIAYIKGSVGIERCGVGKIENSVTCLSSQLNTTISRKRRYLAFPKGTSLGLVSQLIKPLLFTFPRGWNIGLELELDLDLPDASFLSEKLTRKHNIKHREKREIWNLLEKVFKFSNLDGKACIGRTFCDTQQHLAPPGISMIHDMFRTIFRLPTIEEYTIFEEEMPATYHNLLEDDHCAKTDYTQLCPVSLFNVAIESMKTN